MNSLTSNIAVNLIRFPGITIDIFLIYTLYFQKSVLGSLKGTPILFLVVSVSSRLFSGDNG